MDISGRSSDFNWGTVRLGVFVPEDDVRFLVRTTFLRLQVREVLTAFDLVEAPRLLEQEPHCLILGLDPTPQPALEFLGRLRRSPRRALAEMPVLVLAHHGDGDGVWRARDIGIEGVLLKPVTAAELVRQVIETLRRPVRLDKAPPPRRKVAVPPPAEEDALPSLPPLPPLPSTPSAAAPANGDGGTLAEIRALAARLRPPGAAAERKAPPPRPATEGPARGKPETLVRRPTGGKLAAGDIVGPAEQAEARGKGWLGDDDLAPLPKRGGEKDRWAAREIDAETRRQAEMVNARWQQELARQGHKRRTGRDTAGLDISAIVAAHADWLSSNGAEGKRAVLDGLDVAGADLAQALLANAGFRRCDLSDANLAEARLDGADFRFAVLSAADLSMADLGVAHLRHANLKLANLAGASLRGADLSGAMLAGARMAGADFKGAILVGTDLRETDLSRALNLGQAQVDKAVCDMTTRLPPGVWPPQAGDDDGDEF